MSNLVIAGSAAQFTDWCKGRSTGTEKIIYIIGKRHLGSWSASYVSSITLIGEFEKNTAWDSPELKQLIFEGRMLGKKWADEKRWSTQYLSKSGLNKLHSELIVRIHDLPLI